MRLLLAALMLVGLTAAATAGGWRATTVGPVDLLDDDYRPVASLPSGTGLDVRLCLKDGALCEVSVGGRTFSVDGSRLVTAVDGRLMTVTEADRAAAAALSAGGSGAVPRNVVAWGDSLTAGAGSGGAGLDYPSVAEALFPTWRSVINAGVGGQTSTSIAARMNAVPTLLSFAGNLLPAAGPAMVVGRSAAPLTGQGPSALLGTVCGLHGTLSAVGTGGGAYAFARDESGSAVPCPAGSRFDPDLPADVNGRIAWLWLGRNGADPGHTVAGDIAATVDALGGAPFLVGAILTSAADPPAALERLRALDADLARQYGDHYVDLLGVLLAAADGSPGDAEDVARGITPRSLRSDAVHLNAAGYRIVARAFVDATLRLGL